MSINPKELKQNRSPLKGACSGVYFLFNNDDLVYVGESWNCFLGVAEHTIREPSRFIEFTSWSFILEEDETKRRDLKRQYNPIDNR